MRRNFPFSSKCFILDLSIIMKVYLAPKNICRHVAKVSIFPPDMLSYILH